MASLEWFIICFGILCTGIVAENILITADKQEMCTTQSGEQGICVYQFQCKDGVINEYGANIIDLRWIVDDCNDPLLVCCTEPPIELSTPTSQVEDKTLKLDPVDERANETMGESASSTTPSSTSGSNRPTINVSPTTFAPKPDTVDDRANETMGESASSTTPSSTSEFNRPTINVPHYDIDGCGYRNPHGVIFTIENNQFSESEYGEYPWAVAIFARIKNSSLKYLCGGALIDQVAILTTATCLYPHQFDVSSLVVRLGEWDMSTNREPIPHIDSAIEKIYLHPQYGTTSKINDIAIVILSETIDLNHTIGVVCLPPKESDPQGAEVVGVGWGNVPNFVEPRKLPQTILKKAHLRHLPHVLCQQTLRKLIGRTYKLNNSFLCAQAQAPEMLPCKGDTGSPYMMEIAHGIDRYYLVGLSSWGFDCNKQNAPTVLTNVAHHREWIDETIKGEDLNTWSYTYDQPLINSEE